MIVYIPRADGMRDVSNEEFHVGAVFDRFSPTRTKRDASPAVVAC